MATSNGNPNKPPTASGIPWMRGLAIAGGVLALATLAPVIWLAAAGTAGLIVVGVILTLAWGLAQALPLLAQKLENHLLAARKAEARRNPIEQLQNEVIRRAERLKVFRAALVSVGAQIASITQMIADRRHKDPQHVLERQQQALDRLQQFQRLNLQRLNKAEAALDEFKSTVERKESEWRIALAIEEATATMDPNAAETLMQDLLADTALRSVQDRFNAVFAELDVQMSSVDAPTRSFLTDENLERLDALDIAWPTPQRRTAAGGAA